MNIVVVSSYLFNNLVKRERELYCNMNSTPPRMLLTVNLPNLLLPKGSVLGSGHSRCWVYQGNLVIEDPDLEEWVYYIPKRKKSVLSYC